MLELELFVLIKYWIFFMVAISLHQYGHVKAAILLGNKRYKQSAKNTMNPFVHISVISMFTGIIFGVMWGNKIKFMPTAKTQAMNEKQLVFFGIAGMLMNLFAAFIIIVFVNLILFILANGMDDSVYYFFDVHIKDLALINVYIALINLLPIKGLDGYIILKRLVKKFDINTKIRRIYDVGAPSLIAGILIFGLINYRMLIVELFLLLRDFIR